MTTTSFFLITVLFLLPLAHSFHIPFPKRQSLLPRASFSSSEDDFRNFSPEDLSDDLEEDGDPERLSDEELMATLSDWDESVPNFMTVHLTGRIGNDPNPRYFEDGKVVVNLSFASKRKYHYMERQHLNLRSGDEETDWYGLEIWGQTAEFVSKYVDKGMRVGVVGSLQEDTWKDKETGEPRNAFKIIVREFEILESRAEAEARRGGRSRNRGSFSTSSGDDDGPSSGGTGGFFDSY